MMEQRMAANIGFLAGCWPLRPERPTLVMIHGAALSKGLWSDQVAGLSDIVDTIALDLPGHRDSGRPACHRIEDYAASVDRFIDALSIPTPVLCGLSMGGAVALELLLSRPGRYQTAILMHTGARLKVLPFLFEAIQQDFNNYLGLAASFSISKTSDAGRIQVILKEISELSAEVALEDFRACDCFDVMEKTRDVRARVLVVIGEDDAVTPPKYGRYLKDTIPGAQLVCIPRAGHLSPLETPEAVNRAIRGFLSAMYPFPGGSNA